MRVDSPGNLLLGLGTGVVFGTLLQKGQAGKYDVILDQLLFEDGRVAKIMGTAAAVGAVGVHALERAGYTRLQVKPLRVAAVAAGAVLFGTGLAVLGYCPGTTLAAIGAGRKDAIAGGLGMLTGAALFVRAYPALKPALEAGDHGKVTLHRSTNTSPWIWVGALVAALGIGAALDVAKTPRRRGLFGRRSR
jgi:hypothetical protein